MLLRMKLILNGNRTFKIILTVDILNRTMLHFKKL